MTPHRLTASSSESAAAQTIKVAVFGGYGVFGSRLVRLLCRDGRKVVVIGRSAEKARNLANEVGGQWLAIDRAGDLAVLWELCPDILIDAAGPFHAYGSDPYRLAREAIAKGVHYMDLADDPEFCAGIGALDMQARAAGVFALSGMSSVPAISSSAVASLVDEATQGGAAQIDTISMAILPGNRAPRGRAVVASILHQCGKSFALTVDGKKTDKRSWSDREVFDLGHGLRRAGWMIEVPDHRLFPSFFSARTVQFRAGLELGVMNWGLAGFSKLRSWIGFPIPVWFVSAVLILAKLLWPFGTDEGGMIVRITVLTREGWKRLEWRLLARAGEGPYVPAVAARTAVRLAGTIAPGARPALNDLPLSALEAGMGDLDITTERSARWISPMFQSHLKDQWQALPEPVRRLHDLGGPRRWVGQAKVIRGKGILPKLIAAMVRFPRAAEKASVSVEMYPKGQSETWIRRFDGAAFRSTLTLGDGGITERFGPFNFLLGVQLKDDALHFPTHAWRCGPIPLPRWLMPVSEAREYAKGGRMYFDVSLRLPLTGALIVQYSGWLDTRGGNADL